MRPSPHGSPPLRLEFPGGFYHLTARGDRQDHFFFKYSHRRKFFVLLNKEVTQFGDDQILERMQGLVDGKIVQGISKAHRTPRRPRHEEVETTVGRTYGLAIAKVLDRSHPLAYWVADYLLRRVGNLFLREVAGRVGVLAARIFQIQTMMDQGRTSMQALWGLRH